MRSFLAASVASALVFLAPHAYADVTQPNGLVVPLDSVNGEIQLYTLFANQSEAINWIADAHSQPAIFSPLCGFKATFVLKQSGFNLSLAWYNATGAAPPDNDLHIIVPAGSPVGTVIQSVDILNDPAYLGGSIGFALVGSQTHYSESQWNPVCTGCNPVAPWITTLVYASANVPNAYYIAFEDGAVGPSPGSFNNDGDYNDDVYFIEGISCVGGGQPCDTGLLGICAQGITQCNSGGIVCQQVNQPQMTDLCDGLDNDCNGVVDLPDLCSPGQVCEQGVCVLSCKEGGDCQANEVCNDSGHCVDPLCMGVTCSTGEVCHNGDCAAPCDGVICPGNQVCRIGTCVDPCLGVTCDTHQVCVDGVCIIGCDCAICGAGESCDAGTNRCVDATCLGIPCDVGSHCEAGTCVDDCTNAVCPIGQHCEIGSCVDDPVNPTGGTGGSAGAGATAGTGGTTGGAAGTAGTAGNGGNAGTGAIGGTGGNAGAGATGASGGTGGNSGASGSSGTGAQGGSSPQAGSGGSTAGSSGDGGSSSGQGGNSAAGAAGTAGTSGANQGVAPSGDDSGCGCKTPNAPTSSLQWPLALGLAALFGLRRRR